MRYSNPQIRQTARRIPILCAVYFVLFAFVSLFVLQRDLLAQTQFVLSSGSTVYHPVLAASLCTLLLVLLGLFIGGMMRGLPMRMKGFVWFPSFLLLGLLAHWRYPQFGDMGVAPQWLAYAAWGLIYVFVLWVGRFFSDTSSERETFFTYAWPNLLQLIVFSAISVSLSNTDASLHHTLRSARALSENDYERILAEAQWERHPSRSLSALTVLALSETGQLGDRLFAYPQPYGCDGLLPLEADSLLFCNTPRAVGAHLGYRKSERTPTMLFLHAIMLKPKVHPAARDYLLCGLLLNRDLDAFVSMLPVADSLSTDLPRHYREAQILYRHLHSAAIPSAPDGETTLPEDSFAGEFADFLSLLENEGTRDEREFRCRERFAHTYWCYYYFE